MKRPHRTSPLVMDHLPPQLLDSRLPWRPVDEDQAVAPRDGDGWVAVLGPYRWDLELTAHRLNMKGPLVSPCAPEYTLRVLRYATLHQDEVGWGEGFWTFEELEDASSTAEEALDAIEEEIARFTRELRWRGGRST